MAELNGEIRRIAYRGILKALGAEPDEIAAIFDTAWHWKRTEDGGWMSPEGRIESLRAAVKTLPWCRGNPALMTQAENAGRLEGMKPIRPMDICLRPDEVPEDVRLHLRRPDIRWASSTMGAEEAGERLSSIFPGISLRYVRALIAASACAESGGNMIGILATGTTGSGKTGTPCIVSAMMGAPPADLRLGANVEDFRRQVGQALSTGRRILLCNEVDKLSRLKSEHVPKLLALGATHQYRPLYGVDLEATWRSVLVCTAISVPSAFRSPEMGRRFRNIHLPTSAGLWDLSRAREDAAAADALIRDGVALADRCGFSWAAVASELGIAQCDDDEGGEGKHLLGELYTFLTSPGAPLSADARYRGANGWIDLTDPASEKVLEPLMADVENGARWATTRDLEAIDWSRVVGEPVRLEIRKRGSSCWVGRFVAVKS